jgi:hypothetical protein
MADRRKMNLEAVFHVDVGAPDWDGKSAVVIHGRTPGGKLMKVAFPASVTALGYFGREISKGITKHREAVDEAERRATESLREGGG